MMKRADEADKARVALEAVMHARDEYQFDELLPRYRNAVIAQNRALPLAGNGSLGIDATGPHYRVTGPSSGDSLIFALADTCTLYAFALIMVQCLGYTEGAAWAFFDSHPDPWNVMRPVRDHLAHLAESPRP